MHYYSLAASLNTIRLLITPLLAARSLDIALLTTFLLTLAHGSLAFACLTQSLDHSLLRSPYFCFHSLALQFFAFLLFR
jgi:hypothetical protein